MSGTQAGGFNYTDWHMIHVYVLCVTDVFVGEQYLGWWFLTTQTGI